MDTREFEAWLESHIEIHRHAQWAKLFDPETQAGTRKRQNWRQRLKEAGATPELARWASEQMDGHVLTPEWPNDHLKRVVELIRAERERRAREIEHDRYAQRRERDRLAMAKLERQRPTWDAMSPAARQALWEEICDDDPEMRVLERLPPTPQEIFVRQACLAYLAEQAKRSAKALAT